jgi:two-component sensor histidine kinase
MGPASRHARNAIASPALHDPDPMPQTLKSRYEAFVERALSSLTEVERRDVRSLDQWLYHDGGWLWLVGIVLMTTGAAWIAARLPWNMSFLEAAILFNVFVVVMLWAGLSAWFGYRRFRGNAFRLAAIGPLLALAGAFFGASIAGFVKGVNPFDWLYDSALLRHIVTGALVFGFLYTFIVALIANLRNREYRALAANLEAEARQSELSRQLAESKLKLLQSQVEPHFLFNTLGSAQQLAEKGAPEAARLISDLIRFLRAATPTLRDQTTTMRQDADMVRAYLRIMHTRLGRRLQWSVTIPEELEDVAVPPGMLITLVENAIKHGIEPLAQGGRIEVTAQREGHAGTERIALRVADTGAGFAGGPGAGCIGLANVRERLALLFGERAFLETAANEPNGFVARLVLPLDQDSMRARSAALADGPTR